MFIMKGIYGSGKILENSGIHKIPLQTSEIHTFIRNACRRAYRQFFPFCEISLPPRINRNIINAASFSQSAIHARIFGIDRSKIMNPRDDQSDRMNIYERSCAKAHDKSSFRDRVLIFSVWTGISCIRGLLDPIRWFWHFRNALPRSRNVYCKILLPPPAPPHPRTTAMSLRDIARRVALLHETETMRFTTTPHCNALCAASLSSPFSRLLFSH